MRFPRFLFVALAALALGACTSTPDTDAEDVGEAQENIVTYPNPVAVKAAIDSGSWSGGAIMIDGTPNYCVLTNGVWSVSDQGGDTIARVVFNLVKNGTVNTDPGEYQYTIDTAAGRFQLAEDSGRATLIDP